MRKPGLTCVFFIFLLFITDIDQLFSAEPWQDYIQDDYLIRNGKLWKNLYLGVKGHPYFLSGEYHPGDITFNGKVFPEMSIRYDIYNDELVLWINSSTVIILNKEMVEEFYFNFLNTRYHVINLGDDSASILRGYANVYYDGPTALYVKYRKQIEPLAVDNKYDLFTQSHRMYIKKDGEIILVSGKRELFKILADRKTELRSFVKQNKLRLTKSKPQTFVPILQHYDGLRK